MIGDSKARLEDTILTRAAHYFIKKDYESSLACWQKLDKMRSKPKEPRYEDLDGAIRCLYNLKRYEEAAEYADKLIASAPSDAAAWNLHGLVMTELGRTPDALMSHLQAIACKVPAYRAYIDAAEIYKALGFVQAVQFLLRRYGFNVRRSKLPGASTSPLALRFESLRVWSESSEALETVPDANERHHSFPSNQELVDLETRIFGNTLSTLSQRFADETDELEPETTEVRDPSRM